jgi:prepilin-type N-terminal cleavage/methylation domain-containing protein
VTVKPLKTNRAFTLIEMLVVIGIMGVLAAITVPALNNFKKADAMTAATRQLLDDVGYARQMAIGHHTTVYMIFCPVVGGWTNLPGAQPLFDKQLTAYTFMTIRSVGDQPDPRQSSPRYLSRWQRLPEGVIIPIFKFGPRDPAVTIYDPPLPALPTERTFQVHGFSSTNNLPFPSADAPRTNWLPYIAFNFLGQLTQDGVNPSRQDEYIPLARGVVSYARDAGKVPLPELPDVSERPPGNSTNGFNLIHIDWLTGRARLERQEIGGS